MSGRKGVVCGLSLGKSRKGSPGIGAIAESMKQWEQHVQRPCDWREFGAFMELRESPCALRSALEMGGRQDPSNLAAFLTSYCLYPEENVEEGMIQHLTIEPHNQIVFWVHSLMDLCRIDCQGHSANKISRRVLGLLTRECVVGRYGTVQEIFRCKME